MAGSQCCVSCELRVAGTMIVLAYAKFRTSGSGCRVR